MSARIRPGTFRELGPLPWLFSRAAGRVAGTAPPAIFTTLGRTRGTFTGWLHFAARLMPFGSLPRRECELVILTVAHVRECEYEQQHHRRLGARAGLRPAEIEALLGGPAVDSFSARERTLRDTARALVEQRDLSDSQWAALRAVTSEREAIELLLLVGHYDMLATTLGVLRLEPDPTR
ncbi:MAG: carboxymuconolactone decarboxylase family protein [Actinomycetia bacterium]|nr:carboxymuconolactone decarboxylase family protein [Actinomycetes bacterium]